MRAIELITAKEAERRVFMLENPGLPGSGYITNSLFCGMQVIKPGEIAPAHRHTPNALRFIIEGEGAYTTVEGERVPMRPGDFVLTPGWSWHDHGHLGNAPVVWLDALDNPFGQFFGAIFRENYPQDAQAPSLPDGDAAVRYGANLMPMEYCASKRASPLLVYPLGPAASRTRTQDALRQPCRWRLRVSDHCHFHPVVAEGFFRSNLPLDRRHGIHGGRGSRHGAHRRRALRLRSARRVRRAAMDALLSGGR
jgi:gentisate 1,2-dioxygenase